MLASEGHSITPRIPQFPSKHTVPVRWELWPLTTIPTSSMIRSSLSQMPVQPAQRETMSMLPGHGLISTQAQAWAATAQSTSASPPMAARRGLLASRSVARTRRSAPTLVVKPIPSACDQDQGSHPIVGKDGTIYVAFGNGNTPNLGENQHMIVSCPASADCTQSTSWTAPVKMSDDIGTQPVGPNAATVAPPDDSAFHQTAIAWMTLLKVPSL